MGRWSGRHLYDCLHHLPNFGRAWPVPPTPPKSLGQHLLLQCLATIRMRWPTVGSVPRRGCAVAQLRERLFPCPPLHHGVAPQAPMISPLVRPPVTQLLLARSFYLFHLFESLL